VRPDERARDEDELSRLGDLNPVLVRDVQPELLPLGIDP